MMGRIRFPAVVVFLLIVHNQQVAAEGVSSRCNQIVVTVADSWDSSRGFLRCFERSGPRSPWKNVFRDPIPVLLGKSGLAWGRGEVSVRKGERMKREGDRRAPAGIFRIGRIYTYDSVLPKGANYPFRTVTKWDAWPDDVNNRYYNRHLVIDPRKGVPPWFESQKMRHGDSAYRWLIEIRHNSDPPAPGYGSAIFFHTRRGPDRTTAGCTTMAVNDLVRLMQWLNAGSQPRYVLLPKQEYLRRMGPWTLPPWK